MANNLTGLIDINLLNYYHRKLQENFQVEYINADRIILNNADVNETLTANNAQIATLNANNATITGRLNAHDVSIGNLETNVANIKEAYVQIANIDTLVTEKGYLKEAQVDQLITDKGYITTLSADEAYLTKVDAQRLYATNASFNTLSADVVTIQEEYVQTANIDTLVGSVGYLKTANVNSLIAEKGYLTQAEIDSLVVNKGYLTTVAAAQAYLTKVDAQDLYAANAEFNTLSANVANINSLLAGTVAAGSTQTIVLNASNSTIANGLIKSAMIESLAANKITGLDINTTSLTVHSDDNKLTISDNTMLITDGTRTRIQIGKDAQNDYNLYLWDASGNLLWDAQGITDNAVNRQIIDNDSVKNNANISGSKLDIASVVTSINNGTTNINSTRVYLNDAAQTLEVAFNEMASDVSDNAENIATHTTSINAANGRIDSLITRVIQNESDISDAEGSITTLTSNYNSISSTVDSHAETIGSHTSSISTLSTNVSTAQSAAEAAQTTANGNLTNTVQLWFSKANTTAPSKPTAHVTSNSTSGNAWRTIVPAYNASYPYYFYCYEYTKADGTYAWSDVVYDRGVSESMATANTASTNASSAVSTADTAKSTADTASSNASTALSTANAAKTTADSANTKIDNLEIGGRNLLLGTSEEVSWTVSLNSSNYCVNDCYKTVTPVPTLFEENDLVTVSFDWESTATSGNFHVECGKVTPYVWGTVVSASGTRSATTHYVDITSTNQLGHVVVTFKVTSAVVAAAETLQWMRIRVDGVDTSGTTFTVSNAKVERGNKATDWTPAPEDATAYTDAVKSTLTLQIENSESRISSLERADDSITSRVISTESSITSLTTSFNNLEIGGRNLLCDSGTMESWYTSSRASVANGVATLTGTSSSWAATIGTAKYDASLYDGTTTYIWSFEYCSTTDCSITAVMAGTAQTIDSALWTRTKYANWRNAFTLPSTNGEWSKYVLNSRTIALSNLTSGSGDVVSGFLQLYARTDDAVVQVRHMKFEKGNKATDWTPAPEDIKSEVVSLETRVSTAESKITDSAIVNTVRNSTNYQNDLSGITAKMTAAGMTGTNLLQDVYASSVTKVNAKYNRYFSNSGNSTTTCEFIEATNETLPDPNATHFVRITNTETNKGRGLVFYSCSNYENAIGFVKGEIYKASCWMRQLSGSSNAGIAWYNATEYTDKNFVPSDKWERYEILFTYGDYNETIATYSTRMFFNNMAGDAINGAGTGIGQIDMCGFRVEHINAFKTTGRNLCLRSKSYEGWGMNNGTTFVSDSTTDKIVFPTVTTAAWREAWQNNNIPYSIVRNQKVVVTCKVKGEVVDGVGNWIAINICPSVVSTETSDSRLKYRNKYITLRANGDWQTVCTSMYVNDSLFTTGSGTPDYDNCYFHIRVGARSDSTYGMNGFEMKEIMVALGSEPCVWSEAPEDLEASINLDVGSLKGNISELSEAFTTKIDQTQKAILSRVSESYYLKTDANSYISSEISTSIKQLKDSVEIKFEKVQSSLNTIDGKVSANQINLEKYIRFEDGDIILGETGNSTQLRIENDQITFSNKTSGVPIAYFKTDGIMIPTGSSMVLGNYQFVPRENGSLDFKKVG